MITLYNLDGDVILQNINAQAKIPLKTEKSGKIFRKISSQLATKPAGINPEHFLPYFVNRQDVHNLLENMMKGDHVKMQVCRSASNKINWIKGESKTQ